MCLNRHVITNHFCNLRAPCTSTIDYIIRLQLASISRDLPMVTNIIQWLYANWCPEFSTKLNRLLIKSTSDLPWQSPTIALDEHTSDNGFRQMRNTPMKLFRFHPFFMLKSDFFQLLYTTPSKVSTCIIKRHLDIELLMKPILNIKQLVNLAPPVHRRKWQRYFINVTSETSNSASIHPRRMAPNVVFV